MWSTRSRSHIPDRSAVFPVEMVLIAALSVVLTLVLGLLTALAFFVVGGREAILGPGVLFQHWPFIYALVGFFAATVMSPIGLLLGRRLTGRSLLGVVSAAWIGQYLVLASGLLADELTPLNSIYFWLLATGGPIQPGAAWLGGAVGRRLRRMTRAKASRLSPD